MSTSRVVVSVLIAWHATAVAVVSVPPASDLPEARAERTEPYADAVSSAVAPWVDAFTALVVPLHGGVSRMVAPLRPPAEWYVDSLGFARYWSMFSGPRTRDQYMRIRYYVATPAAGADGRWTGTELLFPSHDEGRMRAVQSYAAKYHDEALDTALARFRQRRRAAAMRPDVSPEELPDDLRPVVRFFATRFFESHAAPGERIVRTEIWHGSAPNPSPLVPEDPLTREERLAVLDRYFAGPVLQRQGSVVYPSYLALEREADIDWLLEYFEE